MSSFKVNQIIHNIKENQYYRILWSDEDKDILYWIRVDMTKNIPSEIRISELLSGVESGEFEYAADKWLPVISLKEASEADRKCRDKSWKIIGNIVTQEPAIFQKTSRSKILEKAESTTGIKKNNLYKYLGKYWRGGKMADVFLPDFRNRGKSRDYYNPASKRCGRKKVEGAFGKMLTGKDFQNFAEALHKYYHTVDRLTLNDVYQRMLADSYSVRDEDGTLIRPFPPDDTPSLSQFMYWHNKNRNIASETEKREGEKKYNLNSRGGTGKTTDLVIGPGMLSQIDATIADIFLVRQDDRSAIIGRPTMYFVMDSMSRIVMGMHISLKSPSLQEASMAIMNAAEDKVAYCRKYGIEITHEQWPCTVIPNALLADRGELEGKSADILVNKLGITLQNDPPFRGDLKGIIESHFQTINTKIRGLPGWMDKDYGERCTTDYRLKASLDIREFTAIIIECVLCYNRFHYLTGYPKTMDMRRRHIKPVPLEMWNYGMRFLTGGLKVLEKDYIRFSLLPHAEASICRDGIHFNHMVYSCELAEKERWYDTARIDGRTKITVAYDPRNAAHIYIDAGQERFLECTLVKHNGMLGDFSIEEVSIMHSADTAEQKQYEPTERFETSKMNERINEICLAAKERMPDISGTSHARRIASIAENLEKEIETQKIIETCSELSTDAAFASSGATRKSEDFEKTANPYSDIMDELLNEALKPHS